MTAAATLPNGITLSYADRGEGSAVVFVPGPTDSSLSYEQVLVHMPASVRAIAVSQRGHGDSDKPVSGYDVAHFADDLVAFLDATGIDRAVLAGHSGSCLVVRRVAIDHPERVAGLVLEASPTSLVGHPGLMEFVRSVVNGLDDPIDPEFARSVVVDTSSANVTAEDVARFAAELVKVPARAWHEMFGDLLTYSDVDRLSGIAAPALLVWGDADALVDRGMQDELLTRLANARRVTYAGVGHTPRWEDPARFAADVAAFTQSLR